MLSPQVRLRRALQLRSLSLVRRIITSSPQLPDLVRNTDEDDNGNTSLHVAARLGLDDVAGFLLSQGHEDHGISRDYNGLTPLMMACQAGLDDADASAPGRIAVAKVLIEKFPGTVMIQDDNGLTAFAHAAASNTIAILTYFLDFTRTNEIHSSISPLHEQLTPSLLLTTVDNLGNTPLHHASAFGNLKSLRLLVEAGSDPAARNCTMWTPLDYSASVSAEVYLKNLVRERDAKLKEKRTGRVRLVEDEPGEQASTGAGGVASTTTAMS